MKKALIIIDIQNDYFTGGRNRLVHAEKAAEKAKEAINIFRQNNLPICHVQHISLQKNATFFLPNTDGCNIHESVLPQANEKVIVKHTPDRFANKELENYLSWAEIKHLYVCGMLSHMCIDKTVRTAKRLGYKITLLSDACATKDLSWDGITVPAETVHQVFMALLQNTFADIIPQNKLKTSLMLEYSLD